MEPMKVTPVGAQPIEKIRQKIAALGLTEKVIEEAIAWARKR